jgi:hypothetical protein
LEKLADDPILPMNATDYAIKIQEELHQLKETHEVKMAANNITFDIIDDYSNQLRIAAETLHLELDGTLPDNYKKLR